MKRTIFAILALIGLCACHKDFDELEDTDQRQVVFSFMPQDYLSSVLVPTEEGFSFYSQDQLDTEHRLRIEGYCFDSNDSLLVKTIGFTNLQNELTLCFKHLHRDSTYHFRFVADIVQYKSDMDYFEVWYQLGYQSLSTFYLASFEQENQAQYNVLLTADSTLSPSNQLVQVSMRPITYNGYCIFTELEGVDKLDGYTGRYSSFYLKKMRGIRTINTEYEFHPFSESHFVLPITASYANDSISLKVQRTTITGQSSKTFSIHNNEHRPFVAVINCQTLEIESLNLY